MRWKNPLVGRIRPESLAGYYRIEWPDVARTGGRMLQEYAIKKVLKNLDQEK